MKEKIKGLLKNKTVLITAVSVLVLALGIGAAALTGFFGILDRTAGTSGDVTEDPDVQPGGQGYPIRTESFIDSVVGISAEESDSLGVNTTSAFRLVFSKDMDQQALASSLTIEPEQSYSIEKLSGKEYSMKFDKPLESNSIYSFTLNDSSTGAKKSWAFQTKKQFNVVRTLPRDKGIQIPINTGIEITFTHDDVQNIEDYFEITPKVKGRFEWNKSTVVFIPADSLDLETIYTVTIKKGLGVKGSEDTLKDDYTFKFQTIPYRNPSFHFSFCQNMYNFTPGEIPALQVNTEDSMVGTEAVVNIYSYGGVSDFMKNLKESSTRPSWAVDDSNDHYDETGLDLAATANCQFIQLSDMYWYNIYLLLPSELPEGYYLVVTEFDGQKYYTQLQINRASVYIMAAEEESFLWLNDSVTGKPIADAAFRLDQGSPVMTDIDGTAVLNTSLSDSDAEYYYYLIEPKQELPFVACVPSTYYDYWYSYYPELHNNYWTYMFLDRGMYLPSDTVNVWGVLKPRDSSGAVTEAVLELANCGHSNSVLTSQPITLTPNGTFTGSLKISNYSPDYYEVRLRVGDKIVLSQYMDVTEYTKPIYTIDIESDKSNMYAWDTVDFDISASFFEGTPASGLKLDYASMMSHRKPVYGTLTCDDQGIARLTENPITTEKGWRPVTLTLDVGTSDAEEYPVYEYKYIRVFPKDTMVEVDTKTNDGIVTASFATSRIDISGLEKERYPSVNDYRGESVDIPVKAALYERYYVKRKTGDYYDYINKVRRDRYTYDEKERLIREYSFNTADGKYEFDFPIDKSKNYYLDVTANDSKGRSISEKVYVYNWSYDPYISTYSMTNYYNQYKTGEQVRTEVKYNKEEPFTGEDRRYLFIRMKNGIVDHTVTDSEIYSFGFDSSFIPNMYIKAVCFDGRFIHDVGMSQIIYDANEKKLDIGIKPDRDSYKPGDEVKLSLDVRDAEGKPVSSEVNISIVDEAFFALCEQDVDTLSSLYSTTVSSGMLSEYLSYIPLSDFEGPMVEMGGEGGEEGVRKDFKDTAVFVTGMTGADGKTEVSFKLPDNLTSWRITCQALTDDVKAGSNVMNITSELPFFVDSIFNKYFITGDTPSILVRANGKKLPAGSEVEFGITVEGSSGTKQYPKVKGKANTYTEIQLGSLAAGDYTIRITGRYGSMSDAMERTFRVSDSLLETSVTDFIPLTDGMSVSNDAKGLTSLVIYNEDSSMLYNELRSLYWTWGRRLDQVLARKISGELLNSYFNEERYIDEEFDLTKYQTDDGGLALLTYDSSSPELSAKMCSLAADSIDKGALVNYFMYLIKREETMPEDVTYAYWGLAALKQPVLLDIRSILETEDLDLKMKLILGAALADIGDHQGAYDIYQEILDSAGKITSRYAWIEAGSRDESIEATALCTLIAMKTNAPEKMKMFSYIKSNSTSKLLVNLERMMFVTNYTDYASLSGSFSYELDGVREKVELKKGGSIRMMLTPEQLSSIKFSDVTGNITAARSYVTPISEQMKTNSNVVSIRRIYNTKNKSSPVTNFDRSDTVKVVLELEFSENAPDGYYEITDILPAGFRFVQPVYRQRGTDVYWYYPDEVTGQKVVFGYYYRKHVKQIRTIYYYAKAVSPGTYTADSAALRHTDQDIAGFTDDERITVR